MMPSVRSRVVTEVILHLQGLSPAEPQVINATPPLFFNICTGEKRQLGDMVEQHEPCCQHQYT